MTRVWIAVAFILAMAGNAFAQSPQTVRLCAGNQPTCPFISGANPLPVSGTFSASLGGFLPSLSYGTLTATAASSASTALPTNTGTVAFQNQTTVAVSCTLAAGAATALTNEIIVPAGSTIFVATTGYDHAACINQTGSASNVIVMAGGSGLGTGFGGGGGSGSSGAVFGPTAVGTAAANPPVLMGGTADGTATGAVAVATIKTGNTAAATDKATVVSDPTLQAIASAAIPAGTNIIGKVGIDQTTPGTTNGVQVNAALPAGTNLMGKVGIDQTTPGTTNGVQVNAALPAGTNTVGNVGADPSSGKATPTEAFLALPATTTTQIIALSGSTKTYITSAVVLAGGTVNVTFKYGTGANCGTGTTTLNGPWPLTAQAGFSKGSGLGAVMIVPAGQALCITTDASVTGGVDLTYQQF